MPLNLPSVHTLEIPSQSQQESSREAENQGKEYLMLPIGNNTLQKVYTKNLKIFGMSIVMASVAMGIYFNAPVPTIAGPIIGGLFWMMANIGQTFRDPSSSKTAAMFHPEHDHSPKAQKTISILTGPK